VNIRINRRRLFLQKQAIYSLTSLKYWDISKNNLDWIHLRPNSRLSRKQKEFIDVFAMVHQTSNRHIQAVINNLKFIILDYLTANKSGFLDWRRDFCDWFISSHSIWKVMPFIHFTECYTLRDNALHTHTQHWSIDWNRGVTACLERYVQRDMLCPSVTQ